MEVVWLRQHINEAAAGDISVSPRDGQHQVSPRPR